MSAKTMQLVMITLIAGGFHSARALAATLRVPGQYPTIGAALNAAHNGDRVIVADGTYSGAGNRNLDFAGKHIRVESSGGPANCIIDCQAQGRAFHFHSDEAPAARLTGFTIQNGFI